MEITTACYVVSIGEPIWAEVDCQDDHKETAWNLIFGCLELSIFKFFCITS